MSKDDASLRVAEKLLKYAILGQYLLNLFAPGQLESNRGTVDSFGPFQEEAGGVVVGRGIVRWYITRAVIDDGDLHKARRFQVLWTSDAKVSCPWIDGCGAP